MIFPNLFYALFSNIYIILILLLAKLSIILIADIFKSVQSHIYHPLLFHLCGMLLCLTATIIEEFNPLEC